MAGCTQMTLRECSEGGFIISSKFATKMDVLYVDGFTQSKDGFERKLNIDVASLKPFYLLPCL